MDYNQYYLLSDIPTDYFYVSKDKKTRAMTKKIKKAGINIHRCYLGYRWILKSDYPKLKPFLTIPDESNKLLKEKFQGKIRNSIDKLKVLYDDRDMYDNVKMWKLASDLRLKHISSIRRRYQKYGWDKADATSKPSKTHCKHGDFFKVSIPYIDEYGLYEGRELVDIAKELGFSSTNPIYERIKNGWDVKKALTKHKIIKRTKKYINN